MIAEIRRVLSGKPSTNAWWKLVAFIDRTEGDERELTMSYVIEHLNISKAWKMASVPCGAWPEGSIGWSLSTITKESVKSLEDVGMVWCPAGHFLMGSPKDELRRGDDEELHPVELNQGFWMAQTQVTREQFKQVMGYDYSATGGLQRPVEFVSWHEAAAFCNKLSSLDGFEEVYKLKGKGRDVVAQSKVKNQGENYYKAEGYRLPTEAEWEYACRAGTQTEVYAEHLSMDDLMQEHGANSLEWYCIEMEGDCSVEGKHPNTWGLYYMLGYVQDWTYDAYKSDYETLSKANPTSELDIGLGCVFRGGSWEYGGGGWRSATRHSFNPSSSEFNLGFRFARS